MSPLIDVAYATTSVFKRREAEIILKEVSLADGTRAGEVFAFDFREVRAVEDLEVSISAMVRSEAFKAYQQLRLPCIVEHAGLVWTGSDFPGGLTKPMWDTFGPDLVSEIGVAGRHVVARACVAYCDGQTIEVFTGETSGTIAAEARGASEFYWDCIFIPDAPDGSLGSSTYAELSETSDGLVEKVVKYSQSRKAMVQFLDFRRRRQPALWPE